MLATLLVGCVTREHPYRFGSPMLGTAQLPPERIVGPRPRDPMPPEDRLTVTRDPRDPRIRVVSAPPIRVASAAAAADVTTLPAARERDKLAKPHEATASSPPPAPALRTPGDLRALVGQRDKRDPIEAALAWARELGLRIETTGMTGADLLAWAEARGLAGDRTAIPQPGNVLVFDRATSDEPLDLIAIAIERDARGVTEIIYLAGGVVRRGFVDASRPTLRRDGARAIVNTFLRHGKRWPPAGTRYLTGELLSHVIRTTNPTHAR